MVVYKEGSKLWGHNVQVLFLSLKKAYKERFFCSP